MYQESFSILSPAGYVMDVGFVAPVNGTGTYGSVFVSRPLPGGVVQVRGKGEHLLAGQLSGQQGTLLINCTTGTAGASQAIAFIALSPTLSLGVALDASNRPYSLLVDVLGTTVGQSVVLGPAIPAGTPLVLELAWDSKNVIWEGGHAAFQYNDQITAWTANVPAWLSFIPTSLYVGTSLGGHGLSSFTGVIGKVQVGNSVVFTPVVGAMEAENLGDSADLAGTSIFTAGAKVTYAETASLSGASSIVAPAGVVRPASASLSGASDLTADAIGTLAGVSTLVGASDLTADAVVTLAGVSDLQGESSVMADNDP